MRSERATRYPSRIGAISARCTRRSGSSSHDSNGWTEISDGPDARIITIDLRSGASAPPPAAITVTSVPSDSALQPLELPGVSIQRPNVGHESA
ncbi:MAG: hypothetical protein EA382_14955 [Spirochaetaceae bacterium]|nr:MAG: hypothetical protein EA382_14955 [Spirochaetaceae bacterium]